MNNFIINSSDNIKPYYYEISGGKGGGLLRLCKYNFNVPPFYIITTECYKSFLNDYNLKDKIKNILNIKNKQSHTKIEDLFLSYQFNTVLRNQLKKQFENMNSPFLAVRSSAEVEDSKDFSFAGLLSSYFYINDLVELEKSIKKCWASFYNDRAVKYMDNRRIDYFDYSVAVVVQEMIDSTSAGVMFTMNPNTNNFDELIIDSVFGLGEGLVSGLLEADHFVVNKKTTKIETHIASKNQKLIPEPSLPKGIKPVELSPEEKNIASVSQENLLRLKQDEF